MSKPRVLIVEDDPRVGLQLRAGLLAAGMDAELARDGQQAEAGLKRLRPDLVLLDVGLPDTTGDVLLSRWQLQAPVPVIVVSARTDLRTRVGMFSAGAVDFVPKPFWMEELVHRIWLRLGQAPSAATHLADVVIDLSAGVVTRDGEDVGLTPHEMTVLEALLAQPGRVLTRARLASALGGEDGPPSDRTVDSHIARLRKKLGPEAAERIRTVFGRGYRVDLDR